MFTEHLGSEATTNNTRAFGESQGESCTDPESGFGVRIRKVKVLCTKRHL